MPFGDIQCHVSQVSLKRLHEPEMCVIFSAKAALIKLMMSCLQNHLHNTANMKRSRLNYKYVNSLLVFTLRKNTIPFVTPVNI